MSASYDICLDYDTLCDLQYKLELITHDLSNSTEQMSRAIRDGQQFLAGYQFEKAKSITFACVNLTAKTGNNIRHAIEYLEQLKAILEEYGRCAYSGEVVQ
jgi:hypothetical protein